MNTWSLALIVVWIVPLDLYPQCTVQEQLQQALRLKQQGQYSEAIRLLEPMVASANLGPSELDRIWTYIGHAREELGDFQDAQRAYEQAILIARTLPAATGDYPTALDNLADLDQARGDLKSASRLERTALRLFQKSENHAGVAWASTHLAVIELLRKDARSAERYLGRAEKEAQWAPELGNDYYASLASLKAWLAELQADSLTAITEYQRSIALQSCDTCALTGWQYVLLGKAYAERGDLREARDTMRRGLSILGSTAGERAPKYFAAKLAYAEVLDDMGEHSQADVLKLSAQKELGTLPHEPCRACGMGFAEDR